TLESIGERLDTFADADDHALGDGGHRVILGAEVQVKVPLATPAAFTMSSTDVAATPRAANTASAASTSSTRRLYGRVRPFVALVSDTHGQLSIVMTDRQSVV